MKTLSLPIDQTSVPDDAVLNTQAMDCWNSGEQVKNIFRQPGCLTVRLYLGGKIRYLGHGKAAELMVRFADMAILYFWPYRGRPKRQITDADLNLSMESANDDLARCPAVMAHFQKVEEYLCEYERSLVLPVKKDASPQDRLRGTVRSWENFRMNYQILDADLKKIGETAPQIKAGRDMLQEYIHGADKLVKFIQVNLDAIHNPLPKPTS